MFEREREREIEVILEKRGMRCTSLERGKWLVKKSVKIFE
jgi:hypothetical protein